MIMKNTIWGCKNAAGNAFFSDKKLQVADGRIANIDDSQVYWDSLLVDFLGVNLNAWEIVELTYDTETGKVEVKHPREIGWYLTVNEDSFVIQFATARYWDGSIWKLNRKETKWCDDGSITVVSDIIKDNEYLKGLE